MGASGPSDRVRCARSGERRELTLKRQAVLAWNLPSQAWQMMGASAKVEAATRMERPQGQMAAMKLVLRRAVGPVVVSPCRHKVMAWARASSWRA